MVRIDQLKNWSALALKLKILAAAVFGGIFPGLTAAGAVIELNGGGLIQAQVIAEKSDRVFVDLGFTVLEIPRDSIARMLTERESDDGPTDPSGGDLYTVGRRSVNRSIKEWVNVLGEAVVLVRTPTGLGSGFVINKEGYIVTNDHVIAGENEITITVFEDRGSAIRKVLHEHIRIVATSAEIDLALLKIEDLEDQVLSAIPLGQSDLLRQGEGVFAIGNPLGLERSVSEGIVSIKNRPIEGRLYIQATAQINPGNSGGPLLNVRGEVVGINNMKIIAQGAEGLGFAISSNVLKIFLNNRDAFAFDATNPNAGYRYHRFPPTDKEENSLSAETRAEP